MRVWVLAVLLSSLAATARADVASPPQPMWGSPGPRSLPGPEGRAPVPLRTETTWLFPRPPTPVAAEARDPEVVKVSERVEVTFLRNLAWVRSRIVLRATDDTVRNWPMGIADGQGRTRAIALRFLEVKVGGRATSLRGRAIPSDDGGEESVGSSGLDRWIEWRLDLPRGRDVVVELSYVVPALWQCADADGHAIYCDDAGSDVFAQRFLYQRAEALLFRDGVGRVELVLATAGYDGPLARLAGGVGEPRSVEVARGRPVLLDEEDSGPIEIELTWRDPVRWPAAPIDGVPTWLASLDRFLFAFPFEPSVARSHVEGLDADGWARMVEELLAMASGPEGRDRAIARGLLDALRERLVSESDDLAYHRGEDEGPLPPAAAVGRLGSVLEPGDWENEVEATHVWLTPPDEISSVPPIFELEPEERQGERPPRGRAAPSRPFDLAGALSAIEGTASDSALEPDDRRDARALALSAPPPFGLPNQLVLASRRRRTAWELPAILSTLALAALVGFAARRRWMKRKKA